MKTGIGFFSSDRVRLKLICEKLGITQEDVNGMLYPTLPPPLRFKQRDTFVQTYFWGEQRD